MSVSAVGPPPFLVNTDPPAVELPPYGTPRRDGRESPLNAFSKPDGPSFSDLIDIANPLQHIPLVNSLYRELTGDKEGAVADVVGGALWGGAIGFVAAVAGLVIEDATGDTVTGHVMAMLGMHDDGTAVVQNDRSAPSATAPAATAAGGSPTPVALSSLFAGDGAATTPAAGGPTKVGSYLVFGGPSVSSDGPGASPGAGTLTSSVTARRGPYMVFGADGGTDQQVAANDPPAVAPAVGETARTHGNFLIFGTGGPGATSLPDVPPPPASPAAAPAAAAQSPPVAPPPATADRVFPVPARRAAAPAAAILAMPTTGPGAVPGNANISLANHTGDPAVAAQPWFAGAINQAMDRYQKASRLGASPAAAVRPTDSSAGLESLN